MKPSATQHRFTHRLVGLFVALGVFAPGASVHAKNPAIVGEATMVIGIANLVGKDGVARLVDRGSAIRVGDHIETQVGGHVHLRFVDGGRLSIRPASSLLIEDYSHTDKQPALGTIKFRLDEGVVRSITGAWGEAARERFRLNTPVAAIGVKGTDFVVKSDANSTQASVYTGAIVLTPLTSGCQTSLGPCLNGSEKLLSEDMKGLMLTLSRLQTIPQLVPAVDLLAHAGRLAPPVEIAARNDKPLTLNTTQAEAQPPQTLVADNRANTMVASIAAAAPVPRVVPPVIQTPVVITPPQVTQLVWVRYMWTPLTDGDTFTNSLEKALASAYDRIPGNGSYTLFRQPSAPGAVLASADVVVNFRLAESSAHLARNNYTPAEPVRVNDGIFSVDFTRSIFSTQLYVSNATIGNDSVVASGSINANGLLLATSGNAAINGALTRDGKEAAYAFDKTLPAGTLRGVTLWGR